jgi:hypothetical protein
MNLQWDFLSLLLNSPFLPDPPNRHKQLNKTCGLFQNLSDLPSSSHHIRYHPDRYSFFSNRPELVIKIIGRVVALSGGPFILSPELLDVIITDRWNRRK